MIDLTCSQCGKSVRVPDEHADQPGPCPFCGTMLAIPAPPPLSAPMPPPVPPPMPPAARGNAWWIIGLVVGAVVVIGGVLAAVGYVSFTRTRDTAKIDTTRQLIERVGLALELYYTSVGQYPTEDQGLRALRERPEFAAADAPSDLGKKWAGPYLRKVPRDAWGNELVYQPAEPGQLLPHKRGGRPRPYKLFSMGPDGQEDTDDDITPEPGSPNALF